MEYVVGLVLAVVVALFAVVVGFDRDRAFYPTTVVVVATYYVLFAVMGGGRRPLLEELVGAGAFILAAVIGYRTNLWWIAAALIGHGVFDLFHHRIITDPGVPSWWPGFCMAFDVVFGLIFAARLLRPQALRTS
jgi:hypothetical protein